MATSKSASLSLSPFSAPSPTLAHFNRLIASTSGQDKVFMLLAYGSKIAVFLLTSQRFATKKRLDLALRIGKVGGAIGDARVLYRLLGLFPIISWLQSLNSPATAPQDRQQRIIQKLQGWSMLLYYPMEHAYYLAGKGAWDLLPSTIGTLAIWSCRFWAAFVALQVLSIRRNFTLVRESREALAASRSSKLRSSEPVTAVDVAEEKKQLSALKVKESALMDDLYVQAGYLPLTVHWSLPQGLLPDQVWVGVCGTIAAAFGLKGVWRATA